MSHAWLGSPTVCLPLKKTPQWEAIVPEAVPPGFLPEVEGAGIVSLLFADLQLCPHVSTLTVGHTCIWMISLGPVFPRAISWVRLFPRGLLLNALWTRKT